MSYFSYVTRYILVTYGTVFYYEVVYVLRRIIPLSNLELIELVAA